MNTRSIEELRRIESVLVNTLNKSYTEGTTRPMTNTELELRRVRREICKLS